MTPAEAVLIVSVRIVVERDKLPTFDELLLAVREMAPDASVTEVDAAARPYEVGQPGAYRYEREYSVAERPAVAEPEQMQLGI